MSEYYIAQFKTAAGLVTREAVRQFFAEHPFARQYECAEALAISLVTVSKHCKALRAMDPALAARDQRETA